MADFEHNKANLGAATLSSAITSSQTSITVDASDASTFPSTPFYATISPIGETPNLLNAEIVKVTAISSGTLTVARGQRSTTAKAFAAGSVIFNGVYTQDLDYAQAVGRAFFTASYSAGVFYINNAMLPTTPTDGMSIRVIFSQDVTTGAVGVSLNNGTTYNVYAGAAITSSHGSATTNPQVKSGIIYELVFYNGAWYVMNLPANNSITSDNIDFTTLYPVGTVLETATSTNPSDSLGGTWSEITDFSLVAYAELSSATSIALSKNISSVTNTGAGTYKVTLSKTMANSNYLPYVSGEVSGAGQEIVGIYSKTTTSFVYDFFNYEGTAVTPSNVNIVVFGRLATPEYRRWKRTA